MNTTHMIAGGLWLLSLWLTLSIAFNAGVKKERKSWQEFVNLFKKVNGL